MNQISVEKIAERQLCARIQRFYDIISDMSDKNPSTPLDLLIDRFEQIFEDIVYSDCPTH